MKRAIGLLVGALGLAAVTSGANAAVVWSNSACFCGSGVFLQSFDVDTGALVTQHQTTIAGNGRGVVLVGNTLYYTVTSDPRIHKVDATTGANLGFITTTIPSMSTIGWDGTSFWTSDYTGNKNAYKIDATTGATIDTVVLSNAGNFYDGLEFFNGKLIANRGDAVGGGIYDVYDTSGTLLSSNFFATGQSSTGIAFDGLNFFVSNIFNKTLSVFDGATGSLLRTLTLLGNANTLIEDLSFDYATRPDTGGGGTQVPEPATLALFGIGMLGMAFARRRARK